VEELAGRCAAAVVKANKARETYAGQEAMVGKLVQTALLTALGFFVAAIAVVLNWVVVLVGVRYFIQRKLDSRAAPPR
jgi:hypothetical protein